jgi:metal-sulfur cluster biosynthetic enzyme
LAGRAAQDRDGGSGQRRRRTLEPDTRETVETDELNQRPDLWLSAPEQDRAPPGAQAARDHCQIEHQRRVREHELAEIDDYVRLGSDGAGQSLPTTTLSRPVLVTPTAQSRGFFIEVDDATDPTRIRARRARAKYPHFRKLTLMVSVEDVTDALRDVIDPELGLDFVELGLIYEVEVEDGTVRVTYTLTSPGCPIGPQVSEQIEEFVGELDGVMEVHPTMTFSPPWTPERMSEDAKFALGF